MLILHFNYLIDKGGNSVETYKSYRDKLKSLCPQPKQEWTKEDERLFYSTVWHLRNSVNNGDTEHFAGQLENWLKSLLLNLKKQNEDIAKLYSNE